MGLEANVVTNLTDSLTSAGYTVTPNVGVPGGSLAANEQVWDVRFNNTTPLSAADMDAYLAYLAGGGSLFLMGENMGFATRNTSIRIFIQAAGGPSLTVTSPLNAQTVLPPFTGPNWVSGITFLASAGVASPVPGGALITQDANGVGAALAFGPGSLSDAAAGALVVVFDVNFMDPGADAASQALLDNLVAYLAAPPTTTTTTTSTTTSAPSTTTTSSTTTTLPTGCLAVADGPTFASIICRVEALRDATASASALGPLQSKLDRLLGTALDRSDAARGSCADGNTRRAKASLNQVIRVLGRYARGLGNSSAKRTAPAEIREPLASIADAIKADVKTRRGALQCPADAE